MSTKWTRICTVVHLAVLASSGCDGRAGKGLADGGPMLSIDGGPDALPGDWAMDLGREHVEPDGNPALSPDAGADLPALDAEPPPDIALDLPSDLRRDLGADSQDAAVDSPIALDMTSQDLGTDASLGSGADASPDAGMHVQRDSTVVGCPSGTPYVLALSGHAEGGLYHFHPETLAVAPIATVSCGSPASELNSLTVSPLGSAYVSNLRGELCVVDVTTFAASLTNFDAATISNLSYGMALLPSEVPASQTLFIAIRSSGQPDSLARIDRSTFALTAIGPIERHLDASTQPYSGVELTGGATGKLYGFGVDISPPVLLTIDPETGEATQMAEVPVANPGGFALVDWQGTIYLFFAEAGARGSMVFTYRDGDAQVSQIGEIDVAVIGAGVALCP